MALGKRLKIARKRRGLTQEKLVELIPGLSQAAISALESRDSIKSEFLFAFARTLRVNAEWLQDGVEPSGLPGDKADRLKKIIAHTVALDSRTHKGTS